LVANYVQPCLAIKVDQSGLQQAPKMSRHFLGRQPASALLNPNYQ
jgi:hypothetical protein